MRMSRKTTPTDRLRVVPTTRVRSTFRRATEQTATDWFSDAGEAGGRRFRRRGPGQSAQTPGGRDEHSTVQTDRTSFESATDATTDRTPQRDRPATPTVYNE